MVLPPQRIIVTSGAGSFRFRSEIIMGHALPVYYYLPQQFGRHSAIVFVMHGVKRDARSYRDSWIRASRRYGAAVFAPEFSQRHFPGTRGYNLGRLQTGGTSGRISFPLLEELFDAVRRAAGNDSGGYLLYGHSAGAQFVHRLMLFQRRARVRRAVAANAGWYTLPTFETMFPYGLGQTDVGEPQLRRALRRQLILLLGERDRVTADKNLRSTREALRQGKHRLERGRTHYRIAQETARALGEDCRWRLETVQNAGHNNRAMAGRAAQLLLSDHDSP